MEKNSEPPSDPNNKSDSDPEAAPGRFIVDADGDPVGADGNKLPRILSDIPCRWCNQHARCIQEEQCLGPVAPAPSPTRPATGTINKGSLIGTGDPSAPHQEVGKSYLPGGGGIHRLRRKIAGALSNIGGTESAMSAVIHYTGEAETILTSALTGSNQPSAAEAIAATREALQHAEQADSLIEEGMINLRAYRDSLYH